MRTKMREIRNQLGYTDKQAADLAGISRSYYTLVETGMRTPSLPMALRIKKALGYHSDDLFDNEPAFK